MSKSEGYKRRDGGGGGTAKTATTNAGKAQVCLIYH